MEKRTAHAFALAIGLALVAGCGGSELSETPPDAAIDTVALTVKGMT